MAQWRAAALALAKVGADELARADIRIIALQLEDASRAAIERHPPGPSTGLIEQQRILHRRTTL